MCVNVVLDIFLRKVPTEWKAAKMKTKIERTVTQIVKSILAEQTF